MTRKGRGDDKGRARGWHMEGAGMIDEGCINITIEQLIRCDISSLLVMPLHPSLSRGGQREVIASGWPGCDYFCAGCDLSGVLLQHPFPPQLQFFFSGSFSRPIGMLPPEEMLTGLTGLGCASLCVVLMMSSPCVDSDYRRFTASCRGGPIFSSQAAGFSRPCAQCPFHSGDSRRQYSCPAPWRRLRGKTGIKAHQIHAPA